MASNDLVAAELRELFSTADSDDSLPPAQELWLRARPENRLPPNEAERLEKIVSKAIHEYADILSPFDLICLKEAHGCLLNRFTWNKAQRSQAKSKWFEAQELVREYNQPDSQLRRLCRLAGESIFGGARDTGEPNINVGQGRQVCELLVAALNSEDVITVSGHYFNSIARVFCLGGHLLDSFLEAVAPRLYQAWVLLPVGEMPRERDRLDDDDGDVLKNLKSTYAEDRMAICACLHRIETEERAAFFGYEASRLLDHLRGLNDIRRIRNPIAKRLVGYIESHAPLEPPLLPRNGTSIHGSTDIAAQLFNAGRFDEAARLYRECIEGREKFLPMPLAQLRYAELLGMSNRQAEEKSVHEVLDSLDRRTDQQSLGIAAECLRVLANNSRASYREKEAWKYIMEAARAAGQAADPETALRVLAGYYITLKNLGLQKSERRQEAQVLWFSVIWDKEEWRYGGYMPPRARRTDSLPLDLTGARQFHEAVKKCGFLDYCRIATGYGGPAEFRKAVRQALEKTIHDEAFPYWCLAVSLILTRVEDLRVPMGISESGDTASDVDEKLVEEMKNSLFLELSPAIAERVCIRFPELASGRNRDAESKIAIVLGKWLRRSLFQDHGISISRQLRDRIGEILRTTADQERERIEQIRDNRMIGPARDLLRQILGCLVGIETANATVGCDMTRLVDATKATDIDDRDSAGAKEPVSKDKLGSVIERDLPESLYSIEEVKDNCFSSDGRSGFTKSTVVSFFVGSLNQDNNTSEDTSVSFAVCKRDSKEVVVMLNGAAAALRTFLLRTREWACLNDGVSVDLTSDEMPPQFIGKTFSQAASSLARRLRCGAEYFDVERERIEAIRSAWECLGRSLFPNELLAELEDAEDVVVVPDGRLFQIPLHALPTGNGMRLIERHNISYAPKAAPMLEPIAVTDFERKGLALLVDVESPDIGNDGRTLVARREESNLWQRKMRPHELLAELALHETVITFTHGHANAANWYANRLSLRKGARLTSYDVLTAPTAFNSTQMHMFACHSGDSKSGSRTSREMFGLLPSLLRRGAAAVTASLWECRSADAASLATKIIAERPATAALAALFRDWFTNRSNQMDSFESFFRLGCFVQYRQC